MSFRYLILSLSIFIIILFYQTRTFLDLWSLLAGIQLDVKRNILVPVSQMGKKTAPQQSALAAAQDNAQLVDIILRGPDCLLDVIQYEINSRPEMIIANRKKRKEKRKRRRKQRKQREMRKRLGMSSMDFSGNAVLSGVNWEEEEPEPKSKPEPHWLYQDGHENIIGPVSSSKMREWYQKGKLPLELLVYKIPEHEGSALTNEPPPPSSLNMPARGQGPYADPSFGRWDPIKHPHSQRHQNMRGKFQYLRVILKNHGGPANTFGTPTNFSTMMMTKLMASKWKKKSKGSKKHLKPGEYDSDESSGIEDSEPQMSYEEMEQERMEQEAMQLLIHQETEAHWVGPHFVQERDPITQRTPLATACHNGWYDTCRFLLESGKCKLDAKGKYGYTPLNLASKNGHTDVVRYLLSDPKGKESISLKDNSYHWTPLVWAAGKGHLEITKLLLEAGADPENYREEKRWWQAGALGVSASKRGNEWVVKELIKAGADVNRVGGESGRITALHAAAAQGNAHVVDAILATGRCDTEVRDGNTATALMLACRGGHVRCARLLMDRGCNYRNQTQGGWTGLMYASEGGFDKIVYRMLHWKKKKRTVDGIDTINIPQSNNSSVPKLPSISGMASMGIAKLAAKRVHERATQAVVDRNNGSAPTTQHFMGIAYTPSKKNDTSIHVNKSNNSNGRKSNSVKNYTFFNTQGSKLSRHKLELVCSQESHTSCNALHLATRFGHVKVLKHLLKCKLPLEIIDAKSGTLQTPLGIACCFGHIDCVEQLLKYGAAVEQRQCDEVYGLTPLMLAAAHGHVQIVRELLKIADTEVLDSKNRNAGMIAAANGHKEVFQFISAERKIRERKLAAIRLAEYERVEAIEKAEKAAKEARRQKEQDFKDAALRENRRMAKEKLRLEEEADASRKNKRRKKKKKKKGKGKKKKNQKKQKEKAKRQKKSKKKSKK